MISMRENGWVSALALAAGLSLLAGCSCEEEKPQPSESKVETPAKPVLPAGVDEALLGELSAAAADCKDPVASGRVDCSNGKKHALVRAFNRAEKPRLESLPTLTYALSSDDPKLSALSASVLYASFRHGLAKLRGEAPEKPEGLSKEDAKKLFDAALALPPVTSAQAMPAATHAMTLTGQTELVMAAMNDQVVVQVRAMVYRHLMVYGRLDALPELQKLSQSPSTAIALAAIESPRHMVGWTKAEQEKVCPWIAGFLDDERLPVSSNAAAALGNCAGEHFDLLLKRIEQTIAGDKYAFIEAASLRDACGREAERRAEPLAEKQCDKVRSLQEKAVRNKKLQGRVRGMTLAALAYDYPDNKTLLLAKSLSRDTDALVKKSAEQVATRLESQK